MVIEESELTELQEVFQKISFSEEYFVKVNYKFRLNNIIKFDLLLLIHNFLI